MYAIPIGNIVNMFVCKKIPFLHYDILSFKNICVNLENVNILFDFYFWIVIIIYLLGTGAQPTIVE